MKVGNNMEEIIAILICVGSFIIPIVLIILVRKIRAKRIMSGTVL